MASAILIPAAVHASLDESGLNDRPVHLAIDTDVSLDGSPSREWLVVTPDRMSVVDASYEPKVLRSVRSKEIQSVRTLAGVGSGLLQIKVDDVWIDVLRFSNAMATRFHRVSRALERAREERDNGSHGEWEVGSFSTSSSTERPEPLDPPRCPSCSLRLSHRDEACPRCLQKGQILRRVIELLRPHWRGAVVLCILTILGVVAELIPPKLQQYMVDHVLTVSSADAATNPGGPSFETALLVVVLALAGSRILLSIVGVFKGHLATLIGSSLTSTLRSEMVTKLQNLAISYYDRHQVGSMLSRVAHDSEVMHGLMHQVTGGFLLQSVQIVGVGAMLVWINPKLAMFTLIPVPLVFLGSWIFWQKVYPRYYRLWDASSKQMSVLNGMLSGIRVVKSFAQEKRENERFESASQHLRDWRLWVEQTNANYSAAMSLVFSLGGLIVWYVGGRDVIGREMSLGQLIAFLAYLAMFYAPLSGLTSFTAWLTSFLSGSKRVLELLDTPVSIHEPKNPKAWTNPEGKIEFDGVTFGYDRNQPVLKDISFEVKPGEMIGIVGRSGSGKSTMVNLLGRFYDVQEGSIRVDGIDIRDLSMQQLRERMGIVFQDSFLFRGTIWKNLSYGRPMSTIEEGLAAAKAAGAHDFICRQQLGYETLLGEHGSGLSGGEKQRLSIARTLLYDPKILILDEATSNIDAEAEKSIQEALQVLIRGRTTIAIAHRLSTLRNADRILVFDRGRLIEQGSHAELLSQDSTYARLVRIQTQVSKDPNVDRLMLNVETKDEAVQDSNLASKPTPEVESPTTNESKPHIHWLCPNRTNLILGKNERLELWFAGEQLARSVFIVRTFPASHPEAYLSVRSWNEAGDEVEVGMIRNLVEWDEAEQDIVRSFLKRRYMLRQIIGINSLKLEYGFLEFDVRTNQGDGSFSLRWTQSQAVDFGEKGKLLIDTEDNRYIVPDIDLLPEADREKFLQFVYW